MNEFWDKIQRSRILMFLGLIGNVQFIGTLVSFGVAGLMTTWFGIYLFPPQLPQLLRFTFLFSLFFLAVALISTVIGGVQRILPIVPKRTLIINILSAVLALWLGILIGSSWLLRIGPWPPTEIKYIREYGVHPPGLLRTVVDTTTLITGRNHYYILLICRWNDESVDSLIDQNILKSNPYSITGANVAMTIKFTRKFLSAARKPLHIYAMLVPVDVQVSDIDNVQEVINRGGHLLSHAGYG